MIKGYLVTAIRSNEGLDDREPQGFIVPRLLVMVPQDDVLGAREPRSDFLLEVVVAIDATKEEIPKVKHGSIPGYGALPTSNHHHFMVERTTTKLNDVLVVEVGV